MQIKKHPEVVRTAPVDEPVDELVPGFDRAAVLGLDQARVDREPNVVEPTLGNPGNVTLGDKRRPEATPERGRVVVTEQAGDKRLDLAR